MKVAYFLGGLNRGGAETLILDICRQHEKVPYDFMCVYRHEGNMSDEFKASGAPMIQISKTKGYLRYLWNIRRTLLPEHMNIVHSQTPSNTLILALALLCTGIKIITTFHGHSFADAPWWQRKIVYWASKKIICVSEYQKRYYEQKWGLPKENKLTVVYNGIDFSKLDIKKSTVESVKSKVESARIRLAMIGSFNSGRSQMYVCQALKILKERGVQNFVFFFIGGKFKGEEWMYDECVQYCTDQQLLDIVHFEGARSDVPEILHQIDGFVYSTVTDTFGIAVVEAMAAGVPVIVNDWEVMMEITHQGEWATIFQTANVEQLVDEIEKLIKHPTEYKIKAMKHQADVKQRFSIQSHINELLKLYESE